MTPEQKAALRRAAIREAERRVDGGQRAEPKGMGQVIRENVFGDDDPTTQNTGERIGSFLNKAGEAMTFGLIGDETSAAVESIAPGVNYADRRDHYRQQEEVLERENPGLALGADIGGSVLGAVATGGAAAAGSLPARMTGSAIAGGLGGATYGGMEGEGLSDRLTEGRNAALWGAMAGGAAPAVVGAGRAGVGAARDMIGGGVDNALGRASENRARRAIASALQKSGKSADDVSAEMIEASTEGQPEFRLMDALGQAGQRRASGVVRSGGDGADELARFLQQRQVNQSDRMSGFVDDAFGFRGQPRQPGTDLVPEGYQFQETVSDVLDRPQTSAASLTDRLSSSRKATADAAYDAARRNAGPVDVRNALAVIDRRIGGMQGSGVAGDSIDGRMAGFRRRLAAQPGPDGVSRELSDFDRVLGVKQDVQDAISAATRAGRSNEARELSNLVTALDQALEQSSDAYRAANDGFRSASRVIDAVDSGSQMARRGRAADNVPTFQSMTPDQQRAARVGYGDTIQESIERNKAQAPNSAREFASTKRQQEAGAIASNPGLLGRRVGRENTMYDTYQRALGGSRTADNLEDIKDVGPLANVGRALRDAGNLQMGSAAMNLGAAVGPAVTGMNEPTRQLIARALMSGDAKALEPVIEQMQGSEAQRQILEALVRRTAVAVPQ
ncbi:hypothetical protein ROJ8625_04089 [Roseivivax jejudonensis]|uniref:Uncharacterized protein n=1 Tax=Roseivivax jejudonensis TaxID=1529041 RepID=A0A1X7AB44_9RHOB|nr:hypothetical protein [Roseivivax jejudonensis]SLN74731.1 hypothetical protein ROJ8625_04089 [Roseivivax jejudonensis]